MHMEGEEVEKHDHKQGVIVVQKSAYPMGPSDQIEYFGQYQH